MRPRSRLSLRAAVLLAGLPLWATPPTRVELSGPRITLGALVPALQGPAADVDLGPVPPPGGSLLLDRQALVRALEDANVPVPPRLPAAVRVQRRVRSLGPRELEDLVREHVRTDGLPRGATLDTVRAPRATVVPDGWDATALEIARPPRRTGPWNTVAVLALRRGDEVLGRVSVPLTLSLPASAAAADVARGAPINLCIERGLVSVTLNVSAGAEGDVGDVIPITLRPSGRTLRARIVARDRAVALED